MRLCWQICEISFSHQSELAKDCCNQELLPPHPMLNSLDMGNADKSTELYAEHAAERLTICNADAEPPYCTEFSHQDAILTMYNAHSTLDMAPPF